MSKGKGRKLSIEDTASGFPAYDDAIIKQAVTQFREALVQNYSQLRDFREASPDNTVKFSVGTTIKCAGKRPVVATKIRFSRSLSDEIEATVEDPDQQQLPIA